MPVHPHDIYHHLPSSKVDKAIEFTQSYPSSRQTEADIMYLTKINEDADLLLPVMSDGKRITDIDSLSQISNPVARDMLLSRMVPNGSNDLDNSGLSDDQIAENVIPKDSTFSDVHNMIQDLDDYVREGADMDNIEPVVSDPIINLDPITT